jgi:hypothetical protein
MAATRLAEGGVRELSKRPPEILLLGGERGPGGEVVLAWPAAQVGADLGDDLQCGLATDGIDLAQVGTADEPLRNQEGAAA